METIHGFKNGSELREILSKHIASESDVIIAKTLELNQTLAHTEEIKIQNGGLLGLQTQVENHTKPTVEDIDAMVSIAEDKFKGLGNLPYSQLMQAITYHLCMGQLIT